MEIGSKEFPHKYEMRDVFLDFIEEPKDSPRRNRQGIYESYDVNIGKMVIWKYSFVGNLSMKFVLLDVRFNKDMDTQDILGNYQIFSTIKIIQARSNGIGLNKNL